METHNYSVSDFNAQLAAGPYAWPGGYPVYFVTSDCDAMSFAYAQENAELIRSAIAENIGDQWQIIGCEVNWENASLYCCGSNKRIESAYAEDDAK